MIRYNSTRGQETGIPASAAILNGIAADGGLYVPDSFPAMPLSIEEMCGMPYREFVYHVLRQFLSDFTDEELRHCVDCAYDSKFDVPEIVPVKNADGAWFLELFHGPTIAFKDMALSILPYLMTTAARKNGITDEIVILTATSGDTGKAALAAFADVPDTRIIVFYPKDGVSPVQERQMVTQRGENTCVIAIRGNFDDAQTGVKKMFTDPVLKADMAAAGQRFSSANSINIGRLLPQVAYYIYGYVKLVESGVIKAGEPANITVPTGNFGNILAAYYAYRMGLPVGKLICASNENKVLTDFFTDGVYDKKRPFVLTSSPSMDILVSSNLERLIYQAAGCDAAATAERMASLSGTGKYEITPEMRAQLSVFYGGFAPETDVFTKIHEVYEKDGYVLDPHTAVAAAVYSSWRKASGDDTPTIIASTASPYKFGRNVLHAIDPSAYDALTDDEQFDAMRTVTGTVIPPAIEDIRTAPVRHKTVVDKEQMESAVRRELGLA